ncbi:flagellar export chaperone FliS [Rhodopseudomonas sp. P2A-2r]|uniref:flagellar export chaperone FliS n=2 Tax=unclassified Rhodopseudomonas TaxID=2638247 RepID=UPI0029FEE266|nr:flagellar export chaperone FliS [Rhodopseudomonas sp. P2A-2r]
MMQHQPNFHAAQAYRSASTAVSPLRAVIMMIDGAIGFLNKSIKAGEDGQFEDSHNHMIRATAILRGLSHNLNFEKGGEVAEGLHTTYHALIMACLRSYGRPNSAHAYRRIIASLKEMRDAWIFVALQPAKAS